MSKTKSYRHLKLYLAGPMSGIKGYNVDAFVDGKERLEQEGYSIQLPADLDDPNIVERLRKSPDGLGDVTGMTWGDCLALDVKLISDECDGVAVLPGWSRSRGARLETFVSYLNKKPIIYASSLKAVPMIKLNNAWIGEILR